MIHHKFCILQGIQTNVLQYTLFQEDNIWHEYQTNIWSSVTNVDMSLITEQA